MSADYNQLLDATIQHLEGLKSRGVRHVAVTPETLRALTQPARPALATSFKAATPVTAPRTFSAPAPVARPVAAPAVVTAPAPAAFTPPPAVGDKAAAFAALRERALACVKCPNLAAARKNVVFGVGNI